MIATSNKRERDVVAEVDSLREMDAYSQDISVQPAIEAGKRPRLDEPDATPGAGPSRRPSVASLREAAAGAVAAVAPISSPRTSWLESLYRPNPPSAPSIQATLSDEPAEMAPPPSATEEHVEALVISQPGEPEAMEAEPATTFDPSLDPINEQKPLRKSSIRSGIASWFSASSHTSYISDEPSHITLTPQHSAPEVEPTEATPSPIPDATILPGPSLHSAVSSETASSILAPVKTLTPSTSRYSLRLPLLGASKSRLEEVHPSQMHSQHDGDVQTSLVSQSTFEDSTPSSEAARPEVIVHPPPVLPVEESEFVNNVND